MKIETLANMIPQDGEPLLIELVDRIGKLRALDDDESRLVEAVVKKQRRRARVRTYKSWTPKEDRELLQRQHRRRGVASYAQELGVTETAAWSRLRHLRNLRKGKRGEKEVKG